VETGSGMDDLLEIGSDSCTESRPPFLVLIDHPCFKQTNL
jgi:hypothetical protein